MNEDKELLPIALDLGVARSGEITEGQREQLEAGIKMIMLSLSV